MPDNEVFVDAQEPLQIPDASAVNSVFAKMPFPQLHSITNIDFLNPFVTKVSSNKLMVIDLRFSTET